MAKYFVETNHTFFAVTRDPVSRWISGLNEFMCRYRPPLEWVVKQIVNKKYIYNEHTPPQKIFLRLCTENEGDLKLIKLDSNLSTKLNIFIREQISKESDQLNYVPVKIPHLRNSKYFLPNYIAICKKIYQQYIEPDMSAFKELYSEDYKLYEQGI